MMLKILKFIFITLGVIFITLVIAVILFFIFDPLNLKPLLFNSSTGAGGQTGDKNPLLNESQEKFLETVGVNVENLPSEITPEMQDCFTKTLGEERVKEIENGASPNPIDFFKARDCLGQ